SAAYVQLAELKIIDATVLGWWRLARMAQDSGVDIDPEVFRSVMAGESHLSEEAWREAVRYARLAIDYDRHSVPAWRLLALVGRKTGNEELAREALSELVNIDPLDRFVAAEEYFPVRGEQAAQTLLQSFGGEYPDQTVLELSTWYADLSQYMEALRLLSLGAGGGFGAGPLQRAWGARLDNGPARLLDPPPPDFSFPYRTESLPVLRWAARESDDWVWDYLLALNLWAVDRQEEAAEILKGLGNDHRFAPLFVSRGLLLNGLEGSSPIQDLRLAVDADPGNRTMHIHLIQWLQIEDLWDEALASAEDAKGRFGNDFNLDLLEAKALIHLGRPRDAAGILASTHVLPSENARESHRLWVQAHTSAALDALDDGDPALAKDHLLQALEWPENLGQGRPYRPEERLIRFILGHAEERLGNRGAAREAFEAYLAATGEMSGPLELLDVLAPSALRALNREEERARLLESRGDELATLRDFSGRALDESLIQRALLLEGGRP
ncbi:MAG: hypothetical protein PVJ76_10345, partial [Gemmatimonadota bacterium]